MKEQMEIPDLEKIGACPSCRGSLVRGQGAYECRSCGTRWPIAKEIPRFVDSEHYVGSFGWEWRRHWRTQIDSTDVESEDTFAAKTGLTPEDVRGKLVLDVGVGSGRFSHVVGRWGGSPVGVDLSLAVLSAQKNLAPFAPHALVCQADAFRLPFKEETFDIVFSIGVLHHTPSTRGAFRSIARLVKPGGLLVVGIYDLAGLDYFRNASRYRRYTTALPHDVLHFLSHSALCYPEFVSATESLFGTNVGSRFRLLLPVSGHPKPNWRVLDTFDWYSPRYQWLHSEHEVKRWFEDLGFAGVRRLDDRTMVSVRGSRPEGSPLREPPPSVEARANELAPLPAWVPEKPSPLKTALLLLLLSGAVGRGTAHAVLETMREAVLSIPRRFTIEVRRPITATVVFVKRQLGIKGDLLARRESSP
jgi:SAM-dependent methyltransferase